MKHLEVITQLATEVENLSLEILLTQDLEHKNRLLHNQNQLIDKIQNLLNALCLRLSAH